VKDTETEGERGAGMGEETRFWWVRMQEIDTLEDVGLDGKLILKWIF
jgi:hypothetical protein